MRILSLLGGTLLMANSGLASATTIGSTDCTQVSRARLELYAHARNVINARVTQTSEGRPPKRLWVTCEKVSGNCKIEAAAEIKLVFDPSNPAANDTGDVAYPNVNLAFEKAAFRLNVTELRILASRKVCDLSSDDLGSATMIFFPKALGGGRDIFNFFPDGGVVSWSHDDSRTKRLEVNFAPNGDAVNSSDDESSISEKVDF